MWKTGYGQTCEVPRIRKDCTACMKFSTTISMGYYKNRPRSESTVAADIVAVSGAQHMRKLLATVALVTM